MILQEEESLGVRNRLCTSLRRDNNEGKTISKTNVRKMVIRLMLSFHLMILQEEESLGVRNRLCTSLRRDNNEGKTISKTNVRKM